MNTQQFSVSSLEPVRALDIEGALNGVSINPTIYPIEFAITDTTTPAGLIPTSWQSATWETGGPPYNAWAMLGPGSALGAFTPGLYRAWWRITVSASEKPIRQFGYVQFV